MRILTSILAVATLFFASCNKFEKTKSGMPYKITKGKSKDKFKQGQFIKMHYEFKIKDSVLNSTFGKLPAMFKIDTAQFGKYNFAELITSCAPGDKLEFRLSVDTLKKMGQLEYSKVFKRGDYINGRAEFIKVYANEAELQADYVKEVESIKTNELKAIKDYAASKKYTTQTTPGGTLVVIDNPGTGTRIDSGKQVKIYYTGRLMSNGVEFDGNVKNGVKGEPLTFVVQVTPIIPGWVEGLKFFAKGGKGKLIIPSSMGYGPQGSPPVIPPFSNLVFDIEVADVGDAPVEPKTPAAGAPEAKAPSKQ